MFEDAKNIHLENPDLPARIEEWYSIFFESLETLAVEVGEYLDGVGDLSSLDQVKKEIERLEMLINPELVIFDWFVADNTSRADVVDLLLWNGQNSNIQDTDGETALHLASEEGHIDIVKLLTSK